MSGTEGSYAFFDHPADVGVRVSARSREDLFAAAGRALMEWIGPIPLGEPQAAEPISLEAADQEQLLVLWLQELLYRFHQHHSYFRAAEPIQIDETSITAQPLAVRWDAASEHAFQEVKAVTYHHLSIAQAGGQWTATFILDI